MLLNLAKQLSLGALVMALLYGAGTTLTQATSKTEPMKYTLQNT